MRIKKITSQLATEYAVFRAMPWNMRVLLVTNMIYAFVLPVIEIFVGAYIMRNSNDPKIVALYQLTVYTGIPLTFLLNGYLLNRIKVSNLYSFGMLLSGISMLIMMSFGKLSFAGVGIAGILMGCSFGFFWANRDFLALSTTNDENRNYYYGLETFFYTMTAIIVPFIIGSYLFFSAKHGWFGGNISNAYKLVTLAVFILTIFSSIVVHKGNFRNPVHKKFLYLKFDILWYKMLGLAILKGLAQGYLVTAPAILIMRLVGNEGSLGIIQSISGIITALVLYILGRVTGPKHRIYIFTVGYLIFLTGAITNGIMFSATGVMVFVLCKVLFQPLHDIAYFPIQMRVINVLSAKEKRNEFGYIFNHEFGLYVGRFIGLGLFIYLAFYISETFALKYALIIIAIVQLLSIPVAKHIISQSNLYDKKNNIPDGDSNTTVVEPQSGSGIESNSNRDPGNRKNAKSA
jgi:MFS transporter, YQGE family, putative transporter